MTFADPNAVKFWALVKAEGHYMCLPHMTCTGCTRSRDQIMQTKLTCESARRRYGHEGCARCGTRQKIGGDHASH